MKEVSGMARILDPAGNPKYFPHLSKPKKPRKSGSGRARSHKPKAHKPPKPKQPKMVSHRSAGIGEGAGLPTDIREGTPLQAHTAGSGLSVRDLLPSAGLSAVLLEIVGQGSVTTGAAFTAWQREQDRITNRVWRRPGGLARMGRM